MFNYIINFFTKSQSEVKKDNQTQPHNKEKQNNHLFNEQYRRAYNKLWIEKIRNYHP